MAAKYQFGDLTPNSLIAIEFWMKRGWPDYKAVAITAHNQVECYPALDTTVVGDKHIEARDGLPAGSVGLCQWNGVRKKGLYDYAKRTGQDWTSLICQLEYIAYEFNTTEKYAGDQMALATGLWEATAAFMHLERPKGYTRKTPTTGSHWAKRLDTAVKLRDNYNKYRNPPKPAPKPNSPAAPKPAPKSASTPKPAPKPVPKPVPKPTPKPVPKPAPKPASKKKSVGKPSVTYPPQPKNPFSGWGS